MMSHNNVYCYAYGEPKQSDLFIEYFYNLKKFNINYMVLHFKLLVLIKVHIILILLLLYCYYIILQLY